MLLCKYKNTLEKKLGVSFAGVHAKRIGPFAMVDTVGTIVLAAFLAWLFNLGFTKTLVALIVLSVVVHWLFCIDTQLILYLKRVGTCLSKNSFTSSR